MAAAVKRWTGFPFAPLRWLRPTKEFDTLPVAILLDNVRSMYNVGSFFRTADAAAAEKLLLTRDHGVSAATGDSQDRAGRRRNGPLGTRARSRCRCSIRLREQNYEIAAIETTPHAVDLFEWQPAFPVCIVFGHEVDGIRPEVAARCDVHIRIPMLGSKHSLNVATAGGVVLFELLRKYQALASRTGA